jgi:hypothetical protein
MMRIDETMRVDEMMRIDCDDAYILTSVITLACSDCWWQTIGGIWG